MFPADINNSTQQNPDDVVITLAIRTPLTKAFKGGFKDTPLDFIIYSLLKEVVAKSNLDPQLVEDICLGNVGAPSPASFPPWLTRPQASFQLIVKIYRSLIKELPTSSAPPPSPPASPTPPPPLRSTASAHPASKPSKTSPTKSPPAASNAVSPSAPN